MYVKLWREVDSVIMAIYIAGQSTIPLLLLSLVFSVDREIPIRGSTVPVGNEALPSFPTERWTQGLGFPGSNVHQ